MSTLSVAELQSQVETDLSNTTLQLIIDAVEREIDEQIGPTTGYLVEYKDVDLLHEIRLPAQASSITTVVEYTDAVHDPTKTTLAADDYDLSDDGWFLVRRSDGTNARSTWGWQVVVTLEPVADTERRKQAAVQLARLEITHTGYSDEWVGDWRVRSPELQKERARILERLDEAYIT